MGLGDGEAVLPDHLVQLLPIATLVIGFWLALIARGINLLPQQQKKAYLLSRDQGLSHEEIAATMHVTKEAAKKNICRALNFLRTYLKTHSDIITLFLILYVLIGWPV
jgi:RNA polymerase sigma-70 factor (ECF subfamily)